MTSDPLTATLALWGAITGTIGTAIGLMNLWFRYRRHDLDKADLTCTVDFGFEAPQHPTHKIVVRSVGRRPVVLDFVKYYINPPVWHQKIRRRWMHKNDRFCWTQKPRSEKKLSEGEKTEIPMMLPDGLSIDNIYRVDVVDQAGKNWAIKWPSKSSLLVIATTEELFRDEKKNGNRIVHVSGHRIGQKYYIELTYALPLPKTGLPSGRSFTFVDQTQFENKRDVLLNTSIPDFIVGKRDDVY